MQTWEKVKFLNIIVLLVIVLSVAFPQGVQASNPLDFLFPFLKPPVDYTISGDKVYVDNSDVYIEASPHTLTASGWVTVKFQTKSYSGAVDVVYGFDGVHNVQTLNQQIYESYEHDLTRQVEVEKTGVFKPSKIISVDKSVKYMSSTIGDMDKNPNTAKIKYESVDPMTQDVNIKEDVIAYESTDGVSFTYKYKGIENQQYKSTFEDWNKVDSTSLRSDISLRGMNKWESISLNRGVVAGNTYTTRVWIDVPFGGTKKIEGKYNVGIKPSGASIERAWILDPWYSSGWLYRKAMVIAHTDDGAQTDYQMKLLVGESSGAVGEEVDCGGHVASDFDDIRFTTDDGTTLCDYWIESVSGASPNQLATVWIEIPNIAAHPNDTTIYMYYGNSGVVAASSGVNTFPFFDDFSGTLTDKWTVVGNASNSGGVCTVLRTGGTDAIITSKTGTDTNYAHRARVKSDHSNSTSYGEAAHFLNVPTIKYISSFFCHQTGTYNLKHGNYSASWSVSAITGWDAGNYHILEQRRNAATNSVFTVDDANVVTIALQVPAGTLYPAFQAFGSDSSKVSVDWSLIRKNTTNEPTWGSFGGEESYLASYPAVTVNNASSIEETTATLNATVTSAVSQLVRGFAWGTTSNSTLPVNEEPPASYTSNWTEASASTGVFTHGVTSLTSGDVYYFRGYSANSTGYGWSSESSFLTKPTEPTGFTCTSNNTAVDLSWTKFVGGTGTVVHTVIRYKANSYPTDITDGTLSYNGTATSHVQTGLTNGTPYYFRGWSWAYDGTLSQYSDTYAGCYSTPYNNIVTTGICSGFGTTYAILNGYLDVSGTATQVGFDYGASSSYGNSVTDTGTFTTGNFDYNLTGLSTASVYHYRAKVLLGSTWLYGEDKVFATKGSPVPYEFWNTGGDGDSMKVNSANVTYQTFTTNTTTIPHSITTVKLMLKKVGSPGTVRVSIRNATDDDISFSGSGNITDTAVLRGFAWGVTNNSTHPYNQVPPATYSTNWTEAGAFTPATFTHSYTLALGETIYARSYSYNATTGYRWDAQSTYSFTPTGADLVYGDLDGDSFPTTYDGQTFTMNTEKCLSANTTYAIVLTCPTGDSSNYVMWQTDSGGGYSGGNSGFSANSGVSWTPASPVDNVFEVWGNPCLEVADAKVFADYLEDDDWLITLLYKNLFPPYLEQAKDVSELFTLDLVDGTTVIASTKCFDWGYRPGSIYLSASAVTALGWGSDYKVRIQATFSPYPYAEYELQPTDWKGTDLSLLDSWVRSTASLMETYYSSDLTEYIAGRGICLNSSGGVIFSTNIPELDEVRPNLFSIVSGTPSNDDEDYAQSLQDELAWQTMVGPQITRVFTLGGNLFSIEGSTFGAGIGFIVYLLTCLLCFPAGHAIAAIVIPIPILILLWGTGLAELAMMAILLGVAVIIFVWQFWSLRN